MSHYNEGYRAYYNMDGRNPYDPADDQDAYEQWEAGYDAGFAEDCQGEFEDDTF